MCGIVGIVGEPTLRASLGGMLARVAHRGPDAHGRWEGDGVSLGHARLKIIDVSEAGAQPMRDPDTGTVLVFNGEIYNFIELREELEGSYPFRGHSDTEVILAAWRRWGEASLSRFRGMFALALWDPRRARLFLARDRFGIKPLYYREAKGGLLFASEIKALLSLPGLGDHHADEAAAFAFLAARHLDAGEGTMFQEVKQLPPATTMWVDPDGRCSAPRVWWTLPPVGTRRFDAVARDALRGVLDRAVQVHLRSDVPVGTFVSGGLDSSSMACLAARRMAPGALHTFSSVLAEPNEENALIPEVQRRVSGVDHAVTISGADFLRELPRVVYHHDEPLADGSMYAHWVLCRMAREAGVIVVLSGNGGDEVFGGYSSHVYALLGRRLLAGDLGGLWGAARAFSSRREETASQLVARAVQYALPRSLRNTHKRFAALGALRHTNLLHASRGFTFHHIQGGDPYAANLLENLRHWTVPPFLHYEDRNSMAFGVEVRVPMLDHELFEFVLGLEPDDLLAGQSKQALRQAMQGVVPDPVLAQRGKYGFAAPLDRFLRHDPRALREFCVEVLRDVPLLRYQPSLELCLSWLSGREEAFASAWRTLSLALWYQVFFHQRFHPWR